MVNLHRRWSHGVRVKSDAPSLSRVKGAYGLFAHDGLTVEKDGAAVAVKLTERSLKQVVGGGVVTVETWLDKKPIKL